jgi:hypothetical protein
MRGDDITHTAHVFSMIGHADLEEKFRRLNLAYAKTEPWSRVDLGLRYRSS